MKLIFLHSLNHYNIFIIILNFRDNTIYIKISTLFHLGGCVCLFILSQFIHGRFCLHTLFHLFLKHIQGMKKNTEILFIKYIQFDIKNMIIFCQKVSFTARVLTNSNAQLAFSHYKKKLNVI